MVKPHCSNVLNDRVLGATALFNLMLVFGIFKGFKTYDICLPSLQAKHCGNTPCIASLYISSSWIAGGNC
jgi:hypothetical protein